MQYDGINTSRDGCGYDWTPYQPDRISDANNLYNAWLKAKKGSDWKAKVQMYEMHWLRNITNLQREIIERTYEPQEPTTFITRERGKERVIFGEQVRDRVLEHALNDEVVIPSILPYLIHDNGASLTGKGVGFTRRRLVEHLVRYYNQHGNDGYILLMDYSKYYDNIRHDILLDLFKRYIHDETAIWLLETIIDRFAVDVSYMSDEEYAHCMDALFNSLEYRKLDSSLLTGEKYMRKHLDIGNQTSQSAGILYPSPIDNYIKIVRGEKFYARYMDDSYCIHESREYLQALFADVLALTKEQGIILNENKSHIARLSDYWRFLQVQYSLDETGRIIQKINPRQVTVMRRKMKSISPRMTVREYRVWVRAWVRSHRKLMSNQQYENIMYLLSQEVTKCIA